MLNLPRRQFLTIAAGVLVPAAAPIGADHTRDRRQPAIDAQPPAASPQQPATGSQPPQLPARKSDPLPDDLVREFVWRGHFDLDGVRRMLGERPSLLNAALDWGNGDYEMAIGGAGHMGRRDIAEYLLSQGSRADIFVSAMLGRLDVVKAWLATTPSLLASKGPHGIPLLRHAIAGGPAAAPVVDFLRSLGAE